MTYIYPPSSEAVSGGILGSGNVKWIVKIVVIVIIVNNNATFDVIAGGWRSAASSSHFLNLLLVDKCCFLSISIPKTNYYYLIHNEDSNK